MNEQYRRPRRQAFCNGCKQPLKFIKTQKGRWIPCNPTQYHAARLRVGETLTTEDGKVVTIKQEQLDRDPKYYQGLIGYKAHWTTCPNPDPKFRKESPAVQQPQQPIEEKKNERNPEQRQVDIKFAKWSDDADISNPPERDPEDPGCGEP